MLNRTYLNRAERMEYFLAAITIIRKFRDAIAHSKQFISYSLKGPRLNHIRKTRAFELGLITEDDIKVHDRDRGILLYMACLIDILSNDYAISSFALAMVQSLTFTQMKYTKAFSLYIHHANLPADIWERFQNIVTALDRRPTKE